MKLLVVAPYFYPKIGGMENYAWNISKGLKDKYGWDVVVVTSNHVEKKYKEEMLEGMKIYRLPYWFRLSNTPINPVWFIEIKRIIQTEKPDIINGHTPVPFISDIAARVASLYKLPYVLTYHNDLVKNNAVLNFFMKMYYMLLGNGTGKIAKIIFASSEYYAEKSTYLRKFKSKVKVVPPGVYLNTTKETTSTKKIKEMYKNKKIVLFVGQLDKTHAHKGLSYLIEAFVEVSKKVENAVLVAVGKGNDIPRYQALVDRYGITDKVIFTGYVSEDDLSAYYDACSVVVLPSTNDSEGFGMVLIEAGAHKKPIIGTNVGGIPFVIDDSSTGFVVKSTNIFDLAEAINKLLIDGVLAKQLGLNGFNKVKNSYTWNQQVDKTNALMNIL